MRAFQDVVLLHAGKLLDPRCEEAICSACTESEPGRTKIHRFDAASREVVMPRFSSRQTVAPSHC